MNRLDRLLRNNDNICCLCTPWSFGVGLWLYHSRCCFLFIYNQVPANPSCQAKSCVFVLWLNQSGSYEELLAVTTWSRCVDQREKQLLDWKWQLRKKLVQMLFHLLYHKWRVYLIKKQNNNASQWMFFPHILTGREFNIPTGSADGSAILLLIWLVGWLVGYLIKENCTCFHLSNHMPSIFCRARPFANSLLWCLPSCFLCNKPSGTLHFPYVGNVVVVHKLNIPLM